MHGLLIRQPWLTEVFLILNLGVSLRRVSLYHIVPGKCPWVLAAQVQKIGGGPLHREPAQTFNYLTLLLFQKTRNGTYTSHHHFTAFENHVRDNIDSTIRGFHVYKPLWRPEIGKELSTVGETANMHDLFAVAIRKGTLTIGHVPAEISKYAGSFWDMGVQSSAAYQSTDAVIRRWRKTGSKYLVNWFL